MKLLLYIYHGFHFKPMGIHDWLEMEIKLAERILIVAQVCSEGGSRNCAFSSQSSSSIKRNEGPLERSSSLRLA